MQVLFTTVGDRRFALDCAEILEVLPVVSHRPAGTGPAWLLGLFNLRGTLVPLVDLCRIVDGTQTAGGEGMPIVEPPLSVGTASTAHPRPPRPSVQ